MRTLIVSALCATLCVAPAWAQPETGAQMFPEPAPELELEPEPEQKPRPAEVDLQLKQDLQVLAKTLNQSGQFFEGESYVFGARMGFFGSNEWKSNLAARLNGNSVQIDEVKVIERKDDTVKAAVAYSFKPLPYMREEQPEFWRGARQEVLDFKLGPSVYRPDNIVWQIVPPVSAPPAFDPKPDAEPQDVLLANVAYHLAQKQSLAPAGTPVERSINNLKILGLGVAQLVQDYDEVYAFAPRYLIEAVTPYIRNPTVFQVPETNEIYSFNANISGLKLADINEVYQTVLFYEGRNEKPIFRYDGKAAICFADGHVALVTPEQAKDLIWKP